MVSRSACFRLSPCREGGTVVDRMRSNEGEGMLFKLLGRKQASSLLRYVRTCVGYDRGRERVGRLARLCACFRDGGSKLVRVRGENVTVPTPVYGGRCHRLKYVRDGVFSVVKGEVGNEETY